MRRRCVFGLSKAYFCYGLERIDQPSIEQNVSVREPVEHAVGESFRGVEEHILQVRRTGANSARYLKHGPAEMTS